LSNPKTIVPKKVIYKQSEKNEKEDTWQQIHENPKNGWE
jgi:hypothetical protein